MTVLISHIPKTAGTSLRAMVRTLTPDTVWAYNRELSLLAPDLEFIGRFRKHPAPRVVMGHFSYGAHRYLGVEPAYVTVLRDPVDRVVSLYRYQKGLPDSDFADHFQRGLTLQEFVCKGITEMTNNHACRVLAGIAPDAGMVINQRWLLGLAIHNMERHYLLVGVLEQMEQFAASLGKLLNWPRSDFPRENVTLGQPLEMDRETRKCVVENNRLDIELYQYVLRRRKLAA